jgi:alanine racemase
MPTLFRPTWAEIDVSAFRHNVRAVSRIVGKKTKLLAVLKADAYGHGAVALARALFPSLRDGRPPHEEKTQGFSGKGDEVPWGIGVSSVEEGLALRQAGISGRILLLGSLFPFDSVTAALRARLTPTVASVSSLRALAAWSRRHPSPEPTGVHVKIDTGMGRIGLSPTAAGGLRPLFQENPRLRLEGVYMHLACAEDASAVKEQLGRFHGVLKMFRGMGDWVAHAANSGGALGRPESRYDMVRPGLALYGAYPWPALRRVVDLQPVMSWNSRVVFLKTVPKGTPVSYGWLWRAKRRSRLATLPVGYADGYRRGSTGRAQVLVKGRRCPVVGRVTMDQIVVDVTGLSGVDVGEEVVLLGRQGAERVTAEEMAAWSDTVAYEIFCGVSKRVPRVYVGS